jgi:MFS transporter, DHA1 family, tetracycline resistance protein
MESEPSPKAPRDAGRASRQRRQAAIPFILVTIFLDVLGIGLIIPVLPQLITELSGGGISAGSRVYGLFVAAYAAMQFLFAPVLGALSDRFGRRPVLLVSLLGAGLDYLVMGLAPTLAWLFAARLVAGLTAANITVANAYIADVTPPQDRAKRYGLVGAAFGLGFIVAPAVGGVLGTYGLRLPFFVAAAVVLVNWLYGYFILPESLPAERRKPFRIRQANPVGSVRRLGAYRGVPALAVVVVVANMAYLFLQSVWVLYTSLRFGWGPLENGLALTVLGVLTALVQGIGIRPILTKLGERRAVVLGLASSVTSFVLYAIVPEGWMLLGVMVVGSLGGIAGPSLQGLISRSVSDSEQGSVQGALASLASFTAVVSPLLATSLFSYFTSPRAPFELPGAPFLFGAALLALAIALARRAAARAAQALPPEPTGPEGTEIDPAPAGAGH